MYPALNMYSPTKHPATPTEVVFAQIQHVSRRSYRFIILAAGVALLLIGLPAIWMYAAANVDCTAGPCNGFGFDLSLPSFFPASNKQSEGEDNGPLIPHKIWQIYLAKMKKHGDHYHEAKFIDPDALKTVPSWLALNPDYDYTLVSTKHGEEFIQKHFSNQPRIVETYHNMTNVGMRSDFLRYLLLSVEGGVYSDTDTLAIKAVDNWIAPDLLDKVRLIVGIEFDRMDGPWWGDIPHELQFCQWTIAAAPGHPVFDKMVNRTLTALDDLTAEQGGVAIPDLKLESIHVMNTTGPAAWTDAVFEQLQEYDPELQSVRDLAFMTEPKLIGDVLVLTIDGFGMGQLHSNSTHDGTIPSAALIKHEFHGSWRPSDEDQ